MNTVTFFPNFAELNSRRQWTVTEHFETTTECLLFWIIRTTWHHHCDVSAILARL